MILYVGTPRSAEVQTQFYPVNSMTMITQKSESQELAFAVFTRQAFGTSSRRNAVTTQEDDDLMQYGIDRANRVLAYVNTSRSFGAPDVEPAPVRLSLSSIEFDEAGVGLEVMMHRHLLRDDGRGLAQVCAGECFSMHAQSFQ